LLPHGGILQHSLLLGHRRDKLECGTVEAEAARYSIGKALFGLAQCLREQGRLEEAHMSVIAGKVLLDLGRDADFSHHAWLLLGSIERGTAGRDDTALLESARGHLQSCANYFAGHTGDVWYRSRYELALALLQQGRLDEARKKMAAVLKRAKKRESDKWIAYAHLGLSRIERRSHAYGNAIIHAREALGSAISKVELRARLTLAQALYDAAISKTPSDVQQLHEAEQALKRAECRIDARDLRSRPMLLLLQARVFKAQQNEREAMAAYAEFRKIEHLVEVGRVRELAAAVKKQLSPSLTQFQCPADDGSPNPDYSKKGNEEALRRHLVEKLVELPGLSDTQRAKRLGVERQTFINLRKRYGLGNVKRKS